MNTEAQRIKIAEAYGYTNIIPSGPYNTPVGADPCGIEQVIPDYLNDLNAMAEVERMLVGWLGNSTVRFPVDGYRSYVAMLYRVVNGLPDDTPYHRSALGTTESIVSASAKQRAEAVLKTIGKWEGGNQ